MMKIALKIVAAVILVLILGIVGFITLVDPNQFKPSIESVAKKQGIALTIQGDLSWKLWPSLGLGAEVVTLGSLNASDEHLAEIKQMSVLLAIAPLFSGNFQANHLVFSGVNLRLRVDKTGKNNWSFLTDKKSEPKETAPASNTSLNINIDKISIEESQLSFVDEQAQQIIQLDNFNLQLKDVNTQEQAFPVFLTTNVLMKTANDPEIRLAFELSNQIKVEKEFQSVEVLDGKLQLTILGAKAISIPITYGFLLSDISDKLTYRGNIKLDSFSLRDLLTHLNTKIQTANSNVVSTLALSTSFEGNDKNIALNELLIILDKNEFKGSAAITDFSNSAIKLNLQGDKFNLDDYLPPVTEDQAAEPESTSDTVLPLESLRSLNLNIKIQLNELIVKKLTITGLDWKMLAKNGVLEQQLKGQTYSGKLVFKNQLDARNEKANLTFDTALEGVQVNPLLNDLFEYDKEKFDLQGGVHLRALGGANGATVNQLLDSLHSNATFSGVELKVTPINLQKQFCKLVNLVNNTSEAGSQRVWQPQTQLTEVSGAIKLRDQKLVIDSFNAGVENLLLSSSGKIDLASDKYDLLLPFKLLKTTQNPTSDMNAESKNQGCEVGDTFWAERGMSLLRCKGKLSGIEPLKDCGPDKEMLAKITKDYAEYKIKQKHGAKIEEKKQEVKTKVADQKKKLFDKLQKKLSGSGEEKPTE